MTFIKRHLDKSDGEEDHFMGQLEDPPQWTEDVVLPQKKKSKGKIKKVKTESDKLSVPMRFDVTKGDLVPVIDLS